MQFLNNPLWQFTINATIGVLTIIVTIMIYRKQLSRKGITYQVISDTPILSLKDVVKGRVQILFDNKPVRDVRLIILKVWNSGTVPILPTEYIDLVKINFGGNAEILDVELLETVPSDIKEKAKSSLKIDVESVALEPLLLNGRDSLTFRVLLAQTPLTKVVKVNGRIVGINQILNLNKATNPMRILGRVFACLSYFIFMSLVIYNLFSIYETRFIIKLVLILAILFSALFYFLVFVFLAIFLVCWIYKFNFSTSYKYVMSAAAFMIRFLLNTSTRDRI